MREWWAAKDLAGIPGQPSAQRNVGRKAQAENWLWQYQTKANGEPSKRKEYHLDSLPFETQQYLMDEYERAEAELHVQAKAEAEAAAAELHKQLPQPVATVSDDEPESSVTQGTSEEIVVTGLRRKKAADFAALPEGPRKQKARARLALLEHWDQFRQRTSSQDMGKQKAIMAFIDLVNDRDTNPLGIADKLWQAIPKHRGHRHLTRSTLYHWLSLYNESGIAGLVDQYGHRQSVIETTPGMRDRVLGMMVDQPHINGKQLKKWMESGFPEFNVCSARTFDRFIQKFKSEEAQTWEYMTNPDRWKNRYMAAFGSQHEQVKMVNDLWEMDSTPADWMLTDGRHSVVAMIDMFSRECRWVVSKSSTAEAVKRTFRKGLMDLGKPRLVRTDNGKDYVSIAVKSVLKALDIEQILCLPFESEGKGTIERLMKTMSHGILELLPGFIGHNVAERKAIEARASFAKRIMSHNETVEVQLSSEELQEKLDLWTEHFYMHEPHGGLNGKTPFAVARAGDRDRVWVQDERALDMLLAEIAGSRTITKKGIRYNHHEYASPELFDHVGEPAQLRYNEDDLGRLAVYVHGEFICWAQCPELTGVSRQELAVAAKAHQKKFQQRKSRELRQLNKDIKQNPVEAILQHRIEQTKNVATLQPARKQAAPSFGLSEAAKAAEALDFPWEEKQQDTLDQVRQHQKQLQREMEEEQGLHRLPDSLRERFRYWVRLHRGLQKGNVPTGAAGMFYDSFRQTIDWKTELDIHIDFGLDVDGIAVDGLAKISPR